MSNAESAVAGLIEVMARLRDPQSGCPWDVKQDFASIAPYTIEEAYEVADAIDRKDPAALRDELCDPFEDTLHQKDIAQCGSSVLLLTARIHSWSWHS